MTNFIWNATDKSENISSTFSSWYKFASSLRQPNPFKKSFRVLAWPFWKPFGHLSVRLPSTNSSPLISSVSLTIHDAAPLINSPTCRWSMNLIYSPWNYFLLILVYPNTRARFIYMGTLNPLGIFFSWDISYKGCRSLSMTTWLYSHLRHLSNSSIL